MFRLSLTDAPAQGSRLRRSGLLLAGSACLLMGLQVGGKLAQASAVQPEGDSPPVEEQQQDLSAQQLDGQPDRSETDHKETDRNETGREETARSETDSVSAEVSDSSEVDALERLEAGASGLAVETSTIERVAELERLDEDRLPEWLKNPPGDSLISLVGTAESDDVQFISIKSDTFPTETESQRHLDDRLQSVAADYINEYLNSRRAAMLVRYSDEQLRQQLVRDTFVETIHHRRYGKNMRIAHALVGFDDQFRQGLDQRWDQVVATVKLTQIALGSGVVLALLGTLFGYFRFDTATRGYYTGRLQFAAAAAILAIAAAGVLVSNWIPGI